MACAFSISWANQMHRACKFFEFYAKNKVNLAWSLYNIFFKKRNVFLTKTWCFM